MPKITAPQNPRKEDLYRIPKKGDVQNGEFPPLPLSEEERGTGHRYFCEGLVANQLNFMPARRNPGQQYIFKQMKTFYTLRQNISTNPAGSRPTHPASVLQREVHYFDNGQVQNRVLHFRMGHGHKKRLILVPNWRAEERHWLAFIEVLSQCYEVIYFESREKDDTRYRSAEIDFSVDAMASDLAHFLHSQDQDYHLVAVSIGTCAFIRSLPRLQHQPVTLTMICPILKLKLPKFFHLFEYVSDRMYGWATPLAYRLLKASRQMRKVSKMLERSFVEKDFRLLKLLKQSAQDLLRTEIRIEEAKRIKVPCLIVYAVEDRIHLHKEAQQIATAIDEVTLLGGKDFKSVHQAHWARKVLRWQANTTGSKRAQNYGSDAPFI